MHCLFTPSCNRRRLKWGRFCRHHARKLNRYGHVLGKPIPRTTLTDFATRAATVLKANLSHPGYQLAAQELSNLLDQARDSVSAGGSVDEPTREYARLAKAGVTPLHILSMIAAVGIFDQANPGFLRDTKAYRFAVARAVIGLSSKAGEVTGSRTLEAIGRRLLSLYSPLISKVVAAIRQRQEREDKRVAAMMTPLSNINSI